MDPAFGVVDDAFLACERAKSTAAPRKSACASYCGTPPNPGGIFTNCTSWSKGNRERSSCPALPPGIAGCLSQNRIPGFVPLSSR